MGYRIWRKDNNVWSLAFDTIYENQDKVNNAIAELNARYHNLILYDNLQFLPYLEHINLNKDGSIKDTIIPRRKSTSHPANKNFRPPKRNTQLS